MKYSEFFLQFAGSCRTKHLDLGWWTSTIRRTKYLLGISRYHPPPLRNKRSYRLPKTTGLPLEFFRMDPWEMEYLFMLASRATRGIVEIGRKKGGSLFVLAGANKAVPIYSVDIKPRNDARLRSVFQRHQIGNNVELIVGDSQTVKYPQIGEIDLLFVDGDHTYEGCLRDLENWWPNVATGGHIVVHDSYFPNPPQKAVLDFVSSHHVEIVLSPYIPATHWHHPTGSLAHIIKK